MPSNSNSNTSPEFARAMREAEVGERAPEVTPEKVGNLSGGEQNNGETRG